VIAFLTRLANPKYNDRDWFNANEKVWKWVKQGECFYDHVLSKALHLLTVEFTLTFLFPMTAIRLRGLCRSNAREPHGRSR